MHSPITLSVRTGRHAGATLVLDDKPQVAGRDLDCDIVLSDPSVLGRHFRLQPDGHELIVAALDGPVVVPGRGVVEPGQRARLTRVRPIVAGDVELDLTAASAGPAWLRPERGVALSAGLVAAAALGAVAVVQGAALMDGWRAPARLTDGPTESVTAADAPLAVDPAPKVPFDWAGLVPALADELSRRDLSEVAVAYADRAFALEGAIDAGRLPEFRSFQMWFDQEYPGAVLRVADVELRPERTSPAEPPPIDSIWYSGRAYVVSKGRRYYPGDQIGDGWVLTGIAPDGLSFTHAGETYRVALQDEAETDAPAEVAMR